MRRLIPSRKTTAERQPGPAWRAALLRWLPVGLPLVLAAGLSTYAVTSGAVARNWQELHGEAIALSADAGLSVERVLVSGRNRTDRQSLVDALAIEIGEPMLSIDIETSRERVAALAWVRDVSIEKRLPNTLVVSLVERRPLALWQNEGAVSVVDAEGNVIDGAKPNDFAELMLVVGPDAPGHAAELLSVMEAIPDLKSRVAAAIRIGERRWNLRLDDGIDIQLPEQDLQSAWIALADLDRTEQLLARDVQAVDLRFPDRLVLRLTPDARARMELEAIGGEDT
jgi:cell division protein FtsQ